MAGAKGSNRSTSWAKWPWFKPVRLVHLSFHRLLHSLTHSGNPSRGDPKQARREANGLLLQAEAWGTSEQASPRPLPPARKVPARLGARGASPICANPHSLVLPELSLPELSVPELSRARTPALAHRHRSPVPPAPLCPHLPAGTAALQARRTLPLQAALHAS